MSQSEEPTVYLEDLAELNQPTTATQPEDSESSVSAVTETANQTQSRSPVASKISTPGSVTGKRQRTLVDMFTVVPASGSAQRSKKVKLDQSGSPDGVGSSSGSASGDQSLNAIPFSMATYLSSLSEEQKQLLALECDSMGKSWLKVLKDEIKKPYFIKLKQFLWDQGVKGVNDSAPSLKIYPAPKNIYSWSNLTPLGRVKVVIIGQDPYHGPGQAHGLCFSVPKGITVPPSLRNIYAEIKKEYPEFEIPKHGNLTSWAENGVLLLNTALTVKASTAGSHSGKGWEEFTDKVIEVVDKFGGANLATQGTSFATRGRGIVFMAWGAWAGKRVAKLDKKRHLILTSAHPSPFSANKGFLGNGHFKKANDWLEQKYGPGGCVDWCNLPVTVS